jgi:hypothetical protein
MSKKHRGAGPIPKGNQPHFGPAAAQPDKGAPDAEGAPLSEQDPKRRLGNYQTEGEHAIEQPGGKQGPNR